MSRTPDHASGVAVPVTLRLSPDHLAKFDKLAAEKKESRSKFAMNIIDRLPDPG